MDPTSANWLTFVHLSDIHFCDKISGKPLDSDVLIRHELISDATKLIDKLGGRCNGVLVTGDLAFKGTAEEFALARGWLEQLCGKLNLKYESDVWTIPGNHDIQRPNATHPRNDVISTFNAMYENNDLPGIELSLRSRLGDDESARVLLDPLEAYNEFARPLDCSISRTHPAWRQSFDFDGGGELRVHGLTSAWLCSDRDHKDKGKIVLGRFQACVAREENTVDLFMSHHPPEWLMDCDDVEPLFDNLPVVSLFGHEHKHRVRSRGRSLRIDAGAVGPHSAERSIPQYNILRLRLARGEEAHVIAEVHSRSWRHHEVRFKGEEGHDGQLYYSYELPVPRLAEAAPPPPTAQVPTNPQRDSTSSEDVVGPLSHERPRMRAERELVFAIAELPDASREELAKKLGLLSADDASVDEPERTRLILARARQRQLLAELWREVNDSGDLSGDQGNPFEGR